MSVKKKTLLGTKIFAYLLFLASLYKMWGFADYAYYKFMFQHLSDGMIIGRYVFSVALRVVGIIVACGLFYGKDNARKIIMLLCLLSLVLSIWKHPYKVFENVAILVEEAQGVNDFPEGTVIFAKSYPVFPDVIENYELHDPIFPKISLAFYTIIDIVFAASVLIYFTRPKVKESFMVRKKND